MGDDSLGVSARTPGLGGLRASPGRCGPKDGAITIKRLKGSLKTVQPLYAHRGQPLLDEVAALRAWLKVRPADGSDYLFVSQKGGRLDRTQFFRIFQAVAEAADLPAEKGTPTASSIRWQVIWSQAT